ncbi:MAG TPA: FG-GAP-like repeat-containing protein [Candidatus Sulfotelmatobacter sp.]|nr:FG-GAP-like repeat-containing protein [Candidatus Sulfotelmatobacter sp.]
MNCAPLRAFVCRYSTTSVLLILSVASSAQTYIFGRADLPVGNSPNAIATGDFNGDGVVDVAVTNSYDNTVSILLGQQNATFAPQVTYPTGQLPVAIVTGDFNADGNLDLAVTNGDCTPQKGSQPPQCSPSTVSILLGNGDGTFQPQVTYSVGTLPASIVTSDFNSDGKLDLAVVNLFDNNISILLGNGDGTFQPTVNYSVSLQASYFALPSLVLGDFNGDGKTDLAVAGSNAIFVLLGNGNGTFQSALQSTCLCTTSAAAAGDFNGDGKLDLVVFGGQGTEVFLGVGDGTFYLNASYGTAGTGGIAVADLNGDGKLDLIIPQDDASFNYFGSSFAVQLGNGDGTFQTPSFYGTGFTPMGLVLADFNGDGKRDVAFADAGCGPPCVAKTAGAVSMVLGLGDGTFVGATEYSNIGPPNLSENALLSADFANSSDLDIAIAESSQSAVGVLLGNGAGTFQPVTSFSTAQSTSAIAAGDLSNSGHLDMVATNAPCTNTICPPGTVSVLLGNGDGTFQTHVDYATGVQPWGVALGSFRNNGPLDIAVSNYGASNVSILLGNGDGTFQSQVVYAVGQNPEQIAVGDFNNDGNLDLAVATLGSGASILLGNGDGTFKSQISYGPGARGIIAADFNGDGILDLALANTIDSFVVVLLGNGDGTFQPPVSTSFSGVSLAAADFNGDGKLDLAVAAPFTYAALLAIGNGDGTFQAPIAYRLTTSSAFGLTVGDFNGDGLPDWAEVDTNTSAIGVMLSTPFKSISPASLNFGSQGVGTTSPSQTITLSNPSNVKFDVSSITATGDFAETNTCGVSLAIGENCKITVTFSPSATGSESGAVVITDNTRISPVSVPLSGNGVSGSFLTPYPGHQNFAPQAVGTKSASAAVQLINTGNASLSITSISITGTNSSDFSQTNNCGSSIASGGRCTAMVSFMPKAPGSRESTLSIADNAAGSPQTAVLSGTGLGPFAGFSPASLTFASQVVGTTSGAQTVTLTNTGNAVLNVTGVTASADFDQTNTCNATLAVGSSCQISATFSPSTTGTLTGTITISDNAAGSPQTISVSGNATAAPGFSLGPASGSSTSQTISVGQSAKFTLSLAPTGSFSGTVNLGCSIGPVVSPALTCALSSSSVQITGGASQNVSVTIATTASSSSTLMPLSRIPSNPAFFVYAGVFLLSGLLLLHSRRRRLLVVSAFVLLLVGGLACGGSSSHNTTSGTPPGTYNAIVTATSGATTSNTTLTVVVQ